METMTPVVPVYRNPAPIPTMIGDYNQRVNAEVSMWNVCNTNHDQKGMDLAHAQADKLRAAIAALNAGQTPQPFTVDDLDYQMIAQAYYHNANTDATILSTTSSNVQKLFSQITSLTPDLQTPPTTTTTTSSDPYIGPTTSGFPVDKQMVMNKIKYSLALARKDNATMTQAANDNVTLLAKGGTIGPELTLDQGIDRLLLESSSPPVYVTPGYPSLNKANKGVLLSKLAIDVAGYKTDFTGLINASKQLDGLLPNPSVTVPQTYADGLDTMLYFNEQSWQGISEISGPLPGTISTVDEYNQIITAEVETYNEAKAINDQEAMAEAHYQAEKMRGLINFNMVGYSQEDEEDLQQRIRAEGKLYMSTTNPNIQSQSHANADFMRNQLSIVQMTPLKVSSYNFGIDRQMIVNKIKFMIAKATNDQATMSRVSSDNLTLQNQGGTIRSEMTLPQALQHLQAESATVPITVTAGHHSANEIARNTILYRVAYAINQATMNQNGMLLMSDKIYKLNQFSAFDVGGTFENDLSSLVSVNTQDFQKGLETNEDLDKAIQQMTNGINQMLVGIDEMNKSINDMIIAVDQMNAAVAQMNVGISDAVVGINQMTDNIASVNQGLNQMNAAISSMNAAVSQVNSTGSSMSGSASDVSGLKTSLGYDDSYGAPDDGMLSTLWGYVKDFMGVDEIRNSWNILIASGSSAADRAKAVAILVLDLGLDITMFTGGGEIGKGIWELAKAGEWFGGKLAAESAAKQAAIKATAYENPYELLREFNIPTTLSQDEITLSNQIGLRMQLNNPTVMGKLTYNGNSTWTSSGGLIYGEDKAFGNRVNHVLAHFSENTAKSTHTVFSLDRNQILPLLDEAWAKKGAPLATDSSVYMVNMGRVIGTNGERSLKLVVRPGTNQVITAYPVP
ncbi:methyl-accepting chemotaxis protein [Tumebacillus sp. ITR2]|uniref:Methyl-accepting chemotaxis protein n=1 Tax=Tumebacillus amylolyticus TaxID=2801339 RepID=A0ABS1J467_9BACL|nr:methyl-accepting chemotaxis protein [Tumebacillus amylolyticus]MBL0385060.1 methyl-accepting chemotaxis protein [Tumebacillus amylolyticus]